MARIKKSDKSVPSKKKIAEYWKDDIRLARVDELTKQCWGCLKKTKSAERCHVIPRSLGGTNECINLALLCGACHHVAPSTLDPEVFWAWLGRRWGEIVAMRYQEYKEVVPLLFNEDEIETLNELLTEEDTANAIKERMINTVELHNGRLSLWSAAGALKLMLG